MVRRWNIDVCIHMSRWWVVIGFVGTFFCSPLEGLAGVRLLASCGFKRGAIVETG